MNLKYSCVMRTFPLAAALVVASTVFACKPATPARSVTDGDQSTVIASLEPILNRAGHRCVPKEKGLLCDQGVKGKLTFVVVVMDIPIRRLGVVVISRMKVPCEDALPRFNESNRSIDVVTVTCNKDGGFGAVGSLPIPAAGLAAEDVTHFVDTWLVTFLGAVKNYALLEVIE
jgi:hypothetical protein